MCVLFFVVVIYAYMYSFGWMVPSVLSKVLRHYHFLLECGDFAQVRNNCFHVDNMKQLFQDIHVEGIMTFLRQINLFNKI